MSVRVLVVVFAVLIGVSSAWNFKAPVEEKKGECVDNTLYEKYICRGRKDGQRFLMPGSCSKYYECSKNLSSIKSCSKFFDPASSKCVEQLDCVEVDDTDCVIPTPPPCSGNTTPSTPAPCECPDLPTTPPPPTCPPVVTCPTVPTCPPPPTCPTLPPTKPPTEPPTAPPTKPPTEPPTAPPTKPPTEPPTPPPTKPPTQPPTEPPTKPPTQPPTPPPTKPPTQPPTPPPTKPPTQPPTPPPTKPPTQPPTPPPTQPPTSPPGPCPTPKPGPCNSYWEPDTDLYGTYACKTKANGTMLIVPNDCKGYFYCMGGWSYRKSCAKGQYFNPVFNACDLKENVYCPNGKRF